MYVYMCTEKKHSLDSSIMGEGNFSIFPTCFWYFSKFPLISAYYVNKQKKTVGIFKYSFGKYVKYFKMLQK